MLRAVGCVITLLATVVVIACEDGSSSSVSPASPSSLPFALSSQNPSGGLPFALNGDERRVTLCHVTGNGSYQLLEVDMSAQQDHFDHGDGFPGATVPLSDPPLVLDDECRRPPGVDIEKATNGEDADMEPGPEILVDSLVGSVVWTYVVTNTGDFALTNVMVVDNRIGEIPVMACTATSLLPGESMTCTVLGTAVVGQYDNLGEVTADFNTDLGMGSVSDSDLSHYLGVDVIEDPEEPEPGEKVDLCHLTGNGSYRLINVAAAAVPAHMAHGDILPPCPIS